MTDDETPRADYNEHDATEIGIRAAWMLSMENAPQEWNSRSCIISVAWDAMGGRP